MVWIGTLEPVSLGRRWALMEFELEELEGARDPEH